LSKVSGNKDPVASWLPAEHWIMKTEPDVFSFELLLKRKEEFWDGVRNYMARNFMRDSMKVGHQVLVYHSNATPPGIAGLAQVVRSAVPDVSALDPKSEYFDSKAKKDQNPWCGVTVGQPRVLPKFVSLAQIRNEPSLSELLLLRPGQRLSILPLKVSEFESLLRLSGL
jgi:predicted RNA-binding protein with PUA-like domain